MRVEEVPGVYNDAVPFVCIIEIRVGCFELNGYLIQLAL
jgi:hypothetical protein